MTNNDFTNFAQLWVSVYELNGKTISSNACGLAFEALKEYDFKDISKALGYVVKTSQFLPKVADVRNAILVMHGLDEATLEAKAEAIFNKINVDFSIADDLIVDDPRAVYAFKRCFVSAEAYGNHLVSAEPFDRKAFIHAYVTARPEWFKADHEPNLIRGIYHNSIKPKVRYIGDFNKCKEIALKVYEGRTEFLPRPQQDKPRLTHNVKPVSVQAQVDLEAMTEALQAFNELFKPSYNRGAIC